MREKQNARGFTMIEVMVVLAVIGVLTSIALPAFVHMLAAQRIKSVTSDLMSELSYARTEAIKRTTRVGIARTGSAWRNGWVVFSDNDRDGSKGAAEPVLLEQKALPDDLVACSVGADADVLVFGGDGRVRAFDGGGLVAAFTGMKVSSSKAATGAKAREVVIGPSGRASLRAEVGISECA